MTASDQAKKALDAVTPGPWGCMDYTTEAPNHAGWYIVPPNAVGTIAKVNPHFEEDAIFIAWAREGVPALLAEIAAKDAEIARLAAQPSPDVAALVEALEMARDLLEPFADPDLSLGLGGNVIPKIDAALARVKGPTEYERKVAQIKEDFPNGI